MDNAAALFVDAPVEEGHGARAALLTPSGPVTYADLQRLTDRAAHALRARGVEPEQRVAILLPDGPAWVATFFAALKLGAVAVPLHTRLAAAQLQTVLADCRPKVVVADRALLATAGVDAETLGPRALDFDALVAGVSDATLPAEPVGGDAMAFWLYTPARPARRRQPCTATARCPPATTTWTSSASPRPTGSSRRRSSSSPMPSATRS
jgi:acyl-CoA synthetase (AMP-forming)/AMP-acid ligase II